MKNLSILLVGSGGREHALAWKLAQSPLAEAIYIAPGNAGTAQCGSNVAIGAEDITGLLAFARERAIGLTVVGPEGPLAEGIVDAFQAAGLRVFGPAQAAAQLEASKAFAKRFMEETGIHAAQAQTFTDYEAALAALDSTSLESGIVVKASGLAAGKGVIVCETREDAEEALQSMLQERAFGAAGDEVLIEERLVGPEVSLLAFCDGRTAVPMVPARDHKRVYDHDEGPNTGGMGAFAPSPDLDGALVAQLLELVILPAVRGMAERGTPYHGVLYAGLMLTADGPKVLEFNCRFGDPETQVVLPMLESDLAAIMLACIDGTLDAEMVRFQDGAAATVVMAAPGYPGSYPRGLPVSGLESVPPDVLVFHAGTSLAEGRTVTSGGRVLAVSALGEDVSAAVARAYDGVACIHFEGAHYRTDIGR
jgi:phosphoribosylamine---glycine ligase